VSVMSAQPVTLVTLDIDGSPRVLPGGPSVYIDDVYRGNPVDSRFRIWLEAGEHELRLTGGSEVYWEGAIAVEESAGTQTIEIRYDTQAALSAE
jgi:hypothetical protein